MKKTAIIIAALVVSVSVLFGVAAGSYDDEFQKAVENYKVGEYEEAARILEQYVKERPEGRAYYLLGYANYALGKDDEATRNFQDAYLVAPEMSPTDFRKSIGIDLGPPIEPGVMNRPFLAPAAPKKKKPAPAAPKVKKPAPSAPAAPAAPEVKKPAPAAPEVKKPAPAPAPPAPAVKAPTEKAPPEEAPAPRPRRRPTPAPAKPAEQPVIDKAMEYITSLGVIYIAAGAAGYLFFALSLFIIGRRSDTGGSLLAFVPVINFVWPVVGAANKSKIWILLSLLIWPLVWLYMWMLIAARFGKSKVLGLLFAFIVFVPLLNILFVMLLFKKGGEAGTGASMGFELPEIPEGMPELPEVPGMEEAGEEEPFESGGEPEGWGTPEESFAEVMEAPAEEAPAEEAPAEEAFEFGEEVPLEEAFEEAQAEEAFELAEEVPAEEAFEEAAPHEGAEAWEFPEEEPLEYESAEGEDEFAGLLPPAAVGGGLMGIGTLFGRTWEMYKRRILSLVLITIISFAIVFAAAVIFAFAGGILSAVFESMRQGLLIGTVVVVIIAMLIASAWGNGALVFAVSDAKLSVLDAYKKAWQKVGSFIWITILSFIIIAGGYWFLVIPGVIFTVLFSFGPFILAKEDVRGMSALLKSKEYIRGHFGNVFLKWLVPFAFIAVYIAIRGILNFASIVIPIIPTLVSWIVYFLWAIVIVPFILLYVYNIYQDLRGLKGEIAFAPSGGQKVLWPVLGIVGWIVGPIIFVVLMASALAALLAPLLMNMQQF